MPDGADQSQTEEMVEVLHQFCQRLNDRLDRFADPVDKQLLSGGSVDPKLVHIFDEDVRLDAQMIGQKPHRFVGRYLVEPAFETLGYRYIPEPRGDRVEAEEIHPDFRVVLAENDAHNDDNQVIIGELKPPGNIEGATSNMRRDYLTELSVGALGIATDGLTWKLFRRSSGSVEKVHPGQVSLRNVLHDIRKPMVHPSMEPKSDAVLQKEISRFVDIFSPSMAKVNRDKTLDQF